MMRETKTTKILERAMPDDKTKSLIKILRGLNNHTDQIEASAVITSDGLIKAEILGESINPNTFGAMCASLLSLSKRAAYDSACGDARLVLVEGTSCSIMVVQIGDKGVLALATKPQSRLGLIFVEARKAANAIDQLL